MSLARLSLSTEKARCLPGPRLPFPENSPMPNATALAEARGTCIIQGIKNYENYQHHIKTSSIDREKLTIYQILSS